MWIKYICLENFKNIKTGLKANKIEINFSKRENVICLITGPNGMGKTTLLSCLTPFATLGNLDIRDSGQLILDKKQGYKRIIIMNGDDEFDIEHFYMVNKDSHSVKSYFKLNGKELNPNGNVTSFKTIVSDILHIDMDYLKLIRLGDNVSNLIKLRSSERKNFMSKMLPSVDNYLKYYKKLSSDVRDLKVLISHTIDKIHKLNIEDEEKYKIKTKEIVQGISFYEKEIDRVQKEIYSLSYNIDSLNLSSSYQTDLQELKKMNEKYFHSLSKYGEVKDLEKMKHKLKELEDNITYLEREIEFLSKDWDRIINDIDITTRELSEANEKLNIEIKKGNLSSLMTYLQDLLKKQKESSFNGLPFPVTFTKVELDKFVVDLKNIQRQLNITYEFGKKPIDDVLELMKENVNVNEFVTARLLSIENKKNKSNKTFLDTLVDKYYNKKPKEECNSQCPYKELYKEVMSVREIKSVDHVEKSSDYYHIMEIVHNNIRAILSELNELEEFIRRLPDEYQSMFIINKIFKHIRKCELIYDEKKINELMSIMNEYDNYKKLEEEIEEIKKKIEEEKKISNVPYFNELVERLQRKKNDLEKEKTKIIDSINEKREEKEEHEKDREVLSTRISATENYESVKEELDSLIEKIEKFTSWNSEKKQKIKEKTEIEKKKEFLIKEVSDRGRIYDEYLSLKEELNQCQKLYDKYVILRSANSTKEGVPLLHIEMYLKDTKEIANDLLDIVYDGEIEIDKFDITGDDFKIPFRKGGTLIPDISEASQGESSFLNMAISFALSIQNLTEYNIPLLDEMDSTFDQEKREKSIAIIERQNDIIQSEQTFIISHNNMYDQYPVDHLDFANFSNSTFDVKLE